MHTNSISISENIFCYHCGLDCDDKTIFLEETDKVIKYFCCEGCKNVYLILAENDMCRYYDLEDKAAGISQKDQSFFKDKYDFLDEESVRQKMIDFSSEEQTKITFIIPQMHCTSCIWLLENLYKLNPAVLQSKVNFIKKEVYITFREKELSIKDLVVLLSRIGYEPEINLSTLDRPEQVLGINNRSFYYKLGIAGFCFANIMLLSFPEYLGLDKSVDSTFHRFFGYMNLLLILPVLLYSSIDFFRSAYTGIRQGQLNLDLPISLGIITLFLRSAFEICTQTGAGYLDSLAGLVFFLLTGRWFQQQTYHRIAFERDYKSYFPIAAIKRTDGQEKSVPLTELEVDDVIVVRNNEIVPADAILLKGETLMDYSFVTGESKAVEVKAGETVFAGGKQSGASIELKLIKKVSQSYLTQLWNNDAFTLGKAEKSMSDLANKIGQYFTPVVLMIASISGLYWYWANDISKAVNVFTAVLIIACPCALALAAPFTLSNALRKLGQSGFYIKNTGIIEKITKISHIVFDKTGTITNNKSGRVEYHGQALNKTEETLVKSITRQSQHPISQKIFDSMVSKNFPEPAFFEEISGKGMMAKIDGQNIKIGSEAWIKNIAPSELKNQNDNSMQSISYLSIDDNIKGYFKIYNVYRSGFAPAYKALSKEYAYPVSLITGDNEGQKESLSKIFKKENLMFFNQSPQDKLNYIQDLQTKGEQVLMFGDGLNDAGALKQADVGIAVSENINNFNPACDVVLDADAFEKIPNFLAYSRFSVNVVKAGFVISFLYNIIGLSFAVQGLLSPLVAAILMPLSSITVVLFGTLATNLKKLE